VGLPETLPIVPDTEPNPTFRPGAIGYLRDLAIVMAIELPQPVTMLAGIGMFSAGHTESQKSIGCYGLIGTSFIIGTARTYLQQRRGTAGQVDTPEAS
jgi:hypothetical protein